VNKVDIQLSEAVYLDGGFKMWICVQVFFDGAPGEGVLPVGVQAFEV
jgi:hypothetical protein